MRFPPLLSHPCVRSMDIQPATLKVIDAAIARYPEKRSAVLPVLHVLQAEQGYISQEAMQWVAQKLGIEPINVYEVVTFYPYFREKPIGRRHIRVCRTLPCALRGAGATCQALQEALNCPLNGTSEDGAFTLEETECLASCGSAPVMLIDEALHENVDTAKAHKLAAQMQKLESKASGRKKKR